MDFYVKNLMRLLLGKNKVGSGSETSFFLKSYPDPVYLMSDPDLGISLRLDPNPGKAHLDTNICRYC